MSFHANVTRIIFLKNPQVRTQQIGTTRLGKKAMPRTQKPKVTTHGNGSGLWLKIGRMPHPVGVTKGASSHRPNGTWEE